MVNNHELTWLREEIALGLSKCVVLRLQGFPPEDAIIHVAEIWMEAILSAPIYWTEDPDRLRIRKGFVELTRICRFWPAPSDLLHHLPPRPATPLLLDEPPMPEEALARNRKRIRELIDKLKSSPNRDHP
ncbi:MAG: hypothetical protein HQM01_14305 [Magnetococcales bacterium]|nr:hypothetical protein [Magnetococcales bacterium]